MRFWFHWLWPQARLANTQNLNLIKTFTVYKAANNMLGKQGRRICMPISLQCATCAMHNWAVATAAKLLWVNEWSISIYRNKESTSDFKLLCLLGKILTSSASGDGKKENPERNSVSWRKLTWREKHPPGHSSGEELHWESGDVKIQWVSFGPLCKSWCFIV